MKKKILSLLLVIAILLPTTQIANAATTPKLSGSSGIIMDAATGEVLWQKNADEVREVASMTKVMATYLVLDAVNQGRISLDTPVPISNYTYYFSRDSRYSNIPFDKDKVYTVADMVEAFMCYSACAAGPALGELLYGSEDAFVEAMNNRAIMMGINATFTESYDSGRMSARSMALLSQKIVNECPSILDFASQKSFEFGGKTYYTSNTLLSYSDPSIGKVDGLKTGWSPAAGSCMAATATKGSSRLITVTMNAPTVNGRITDSAALLSAGFEAIEEKLENGYSYASPHVVTVRLNGETVAMNSYVANGNNYVRLRDFAAVLNGTGSQFSLEYDSGSQAVVINNGAAYQGDLNINVTSGGNTVLTKLQQPVMMVDNAPYAVNTYLIGQLNYMKIRDLAQAVGCGIDWDATTGQVVLVPSETTSQTDDSTLEVDNTAAADVAA